jgi:hypothetical protein
MAKANKAVTEHINFNVMADPFWHMTRLDTAPDNGHSVAEQNSLRRFGDADR